MTRAVRGSDIERNQGQQSPVQGSARGTPGASGDGNAPATATAQPLNVSGNERWVSAVCGGALALFGIKRRTFPGALMVLAGGALVYRGVTGHCSTYAALGIDTADQGPAEPKEYFERGVHVEESVTINRSPEELYQFWRNFENLPRFMEHLESVKVIDEKKSHWKAKAPAGMTVEWDAEIINEEPHSVIAWRSLGGATVDNAGSVRFVPAPGDRGTEVRVTLDYIPPAWRIGHVGRWVAKLFGEEPGAQVKDDLRHFKQIMEAGEIPTIEGQPQGS